MSGATRVLLPPTASHLADVVLEAGCTPVVDATFGSVPEVPGGAWVRTRPGRPAPGSGPVILAELGAAIPDRETWLETAVPREVPSGFAGLVLKGREAGGVCGAQDGLVALAQCPEPGRVLLDAGLGPDTAAAAAALGAAGILVAEAHLGCPELQLPQGMAQRLALSDDEITRILAGVRVSASPTAPVLRRLLEGDDPWSLAAELWATGDPSRHLWLAGQGLALARPLAERHGSLSALLAAYQQAWLGHAGRTRSARAHTTEARPVGTAAALASPGTAATTGGSLGSGVLWQEAVWLGRPLHGGPLAAAAATGGAVIASAEALDAIRPAPAAAPAEVGPEPRPSATGAIAIVGIGCRFPGGSNSVEAFWDNVVNGVYAIGEVPAERWDPALYWDPDQAAPDKTYAKIGGFLEGFEFNSKRFRIPPAVARQVDPVQQITLACVADALADAGLKVDRRSDGREFDRTRTAVILGNSLGGEVSDDYAIRLAWPDVARRLVSVPPFCDLSQAERQRFLEQMEAAYKAGLPVVDEDSMPGELANVIAGRIANAFDLGGANFTVDAACASSMAAIQTAAKTLIAGDADLVVTGGADRSMNIATYVKFCKIGALSPDHSAPFDASANGFVMGEGCGILLLKRYEDAIADGDRIYAVIRGIGASSDGKGKGITAPNIQGQLRALSRAYEDAGLQPWQIDLIEAHGTSTVVGDKVEVEALSQVIGSDHRGDRGPVRIGSVKSMIGHLKSAAGAASVIKAALALHHGILPPSLGFRGARQDVPLGVVPLQVQQTAEPWPQTPDGLRRAGVSAFGFGGTNFHVVLESYAGQTLPVSVPKAPTAPQPHPAQLPAQPAAARPAPAQPTPAQATATARIEAGTPAPTPDAHGLPQGIWAASGLDQEELLDNLRALEQGRHVPFQPSAPLRLAAAPRDAEERASQLTRAIRTIEKGSNPDLLRARSIAYEDGPFDGKIALLFTGQGSQYLDMGLDLAGAFPRVAATFAEADRVLAPTLGRGITDYIRLAEGEDADQKSDLLRQTEYSQPATLTLDVAILRLLASYGVLPDLVAGHSLGEYGAAVAAGVMTFEQALLAVSARGREMASIRLDDPGKMAGIATGSKAVEEVLAEVDGYVIPANKNCPTQTVIAGASDAVDEACERFRARGVTVYPLPVSHAFHSAIVAPASEPLRGVLDRLGLSAPRRPITTNVTGEYYPTGPDAVPQIIELLSRQISGPVEWTSQMERMYADGARVFVECGPKRALSGFTVSILKRRPHRALYTNHPKRGGVASFRDALAGLVALGMPVRAEPAEAVDLFATPEPRRATTQAITAFTELHRTRTEAAPDLEEGIVRIVARTSGYEPEELDLDYELEADLGIDTVKQAEVFSVVRATYGIPADPDFSFAQHRTLRSLIGWAAQRTGATRIAVARPQPQPQPQPAAPAAPAPAAPATPLLAPDVVTRFLTQAAEAGLAGLDAQRFAEALLPAVQGLITAAFEASRHASTIAAEAPVAPAVPQPARQVPSPAPTQPRRTRLPGQPRAIDVGARILCTGAAVGLPGGEAVFGADNFARILSGDSRLSHIGDRSERFLELGLTRLVKDPQTGQGSFLDVTSTDEVIRLAGTEAAFDLTEWGIDAGLIEALDVTTQLAFAAGLEALRDAGIPLVRSYRQTQTGKRVPRGWGLPEALRDGTGVIFGSAFPGYDRFARHLASGGRDASGRFDRRFLFQILAMGHSQFAQLIGARGPNASVNAACASSTQAMALAEDWIRMGRCERVIVIGADDVTSEALLPWIGGGFMAAGAATTHDVVEEAALPFDRRRHGLILGMGAVGIVLEAADVVEARGVVPLAEQLGTTIVNSAFHGTRLDVDHIAGAMKTLVDDVCEAEGITPAEMARSALFMSHETYTPARGGSAAAEIEALRRAFGGAASQIVVSNTKGQTGHPMGAGIEDGVVLKALQYGIVPPIANLQQPDEALGDLTLSRGHRGDFRYSVRLAAGFGSQLAVTIHKAVARGDERIADPGRRLQWLKDVTGYAHVAEVIEDRTLRAIASERDQPYDLRPDVSPAGLQPAQLPTVAAPAAVAPAATAPVAATTAATAIAATTAVTPAPAPAAPAAAPQDVLQDLITVIATRTGYEPEEIEPDYELEADLGIDTVKQAEILGELTERYGIERDDGFRLSDYPTIEALAGYLSSASAAVAAPSVPSAPTPTPAAVAVPSAAPTPAAPATTATSPTATTPTATTPAATTPAVPAATATTPAPAASARASASGDTLSDLIEIVSAKTGYEPDELEPDYELEADLGIDTVKQAEILGELTERYGIERDDSFRLSDYPTIEALAGYLSDASTAAPPAPGAPPTPQAPAPAATPQAPPAPATPTAPTPLEASGAVVPDEVPITAPTLVPQPRREVAPPRPTPTNGSDAQQTLTTLIAVVADKTGYDIEDLDPSYELEADLGVDTVKQAEILSELSEVLGLQPDDDFRPADHPTLEELAAYLHARTSEAPPEPPTPTAPAPGAPDAPIPARTAGAHVALPASFRIRRVQRAPRTRQGRSEDFLDGLHIDVIGEGPVAQALRHEIVQRRGSLQPPHDTVIDASGDVLTSLHRARALADDEALRPSRWLTVTRLGGLAGPGIDEALRDGASAGFTKSLGREWPQTTARVIDLHPHHSASRAATLICDELLDDRDLEVFFDHDGTRHGIRLEVTPPPTHGSLSGAPVVLLTGGGRGITARVAAELASRGPVHLALVGRSGVPGEALDERAAKARIKAEIQASGERATPARIEAQLAPLRKGEEVRQTLEHLRSLGATVTYFQADLAQEASTRDLVRRVTEQLGPIDVLIHGAGVEESRLLTDKSDEAFHRVFDGKALGGHVLLSAVPDSTRFVSMGSVAGRFGNPGQTDYAAANDALARMCHTRPHSLHLDWTAWDDVGMAVRGGMRSLLEGRGVDLLPADAGACLLVDLIAAGATGELVVAGALGDFEDEQPPTLDSLQIDVDRAIGTRTISRARDPWIVDHAIEGTPLLPGVVGLELMAAAAAVLCPDQALTGARDVRFSAPAKIHRDQSIELIVEAQRVGPGEVRATLTSVRTLRTGRVNQVEHFAATLSFGEGAPVEGLPSAFLPDEGVDQAGIYRRFFHGPAFQVLTGVYGVSADGLLAEGTALSLLAEPVTAPLILEAAFQAAGLHRMIVAHQMGLPSQIEEVRLLGRPTPGADISVLVRHLDGVYHVDVDSLDGPLLRLRGFGMIDRGPVPDPDRFPEPALPRPSCFPTSTAPRRSGDSAVAEASADEDTSPWLTADELAALRARGTERRIRDRVAGRMAAKRALARLTGVDPLEIQVISAPSGEPRAQVPGHPHVRISLSHREGRAIAIAVDTGHVGIDLERIESRPESFSRTWFDPEEREAISHDPARETVAWAIKEAVLKLIGTGMACSPHDVKIRAIGDGTAEIEAIGEVAERLEARGASTVRIGWATVGADEVVVTARAA